MYLNGRARFSNFLVATLREILYYIDPTLSEGRLHVDVNDVHDDNHSTKKEELIGDCERIMKEYSIRCSFDSSSVFNTKVNSSSLNEVNKQVRKL